MKVKPAEKRRATKALKECKDKLSILELKLKSRADGLVKDKLIEDAEKLRAEIRRLSNLFQHGAIPNER